MKDNMLDDLKSVSIRKRMVTSIEYECKNEQQEDEIFDKVRNIVTDHLDEFAKITYDLEADHKVKVEVIENR